MGWIQNFVKNPVNPLNLLSAAFIKPVAFVQNPKKASEAVLNQSLAKNITSTVTNTAIAASVLTAGASLVGAGGTAGKVGAAVISRFSTIKKATTTLALAGGAIVGTNILASSPKATIQILNTPDKLANFGTNIGAAIEKPSIESGMKILKENPGLSAASAAALLAGLGYSGSALANLLATYKNTDAVKKNTEATNAAQQTQLVNAPQATAPGTYIIINPAPQTAVAASNLETDIKPKVVTKKKVKKKKKKKKKKKAKKKVYKKKRTKKKKKKR